MELSGKRPTICSKNSDAFLNGAYFTGDLSPTIIATGASTILPLSRTSSTCVAPFLLAVIKGSFLISPIELKF